MFIAALKEHGLSWKDGVIPELGGDGGLAVDVGRLESWVRGSRSELDAELVEAGKEKGTAHGTLGRQWWSMMLWRH